MSNLLTLRKPNQRQIVSTRDTMSNVLHNTPAKNYIKPWLWYIHSIIYPYDLTYMLLKFYSIFFIFTYFILFWIIITVITIANKEEIMLYIVHIAKCASIKYVNLVLPLTHSMYVYIYINIYNSFIHILWLFNYVIYNSA